MEWINIATSVIRSEEFTDSTPLQQSVWLRLIAYCVDQENGGRIKGAQEWSEMKCCLTLRCTKDEILQNCKLWAWKGDELKLEFYPKYQEECIRAKRKGAKAGANARWKKPEKTNENTETNTSPNAIGMPDSDAIKNAIGNAIGMPEGDAECNVMECNGKNVCSAGDRNFIQEAEDLVVLWPKQREVDGAKLAIIAALKEGCDPDVIRAGTAAIAAVVRRKAPGGAESNRYVVGAGTFFADRRWADSPAAYERQWEDFKGIQAAHASERLAVKMPEINGLD